MWTLWSLVQLTIGICRWSISSIGKNNDNFFSCLPNMLCSNHCNICIFKKTHRSITSRSLFPSSGSSLNNVSLSFQYWWSVQILHVAGALDFNLNWLGLIGFQPKVVSSFHALRDPLIKYWLNSTTMMKVSINTDQSITLF